MATATPRPPAPSNAAHDAILEEIFGKPPTASPAPQPDDDNGPADPPELRALEARAIQAAEKGDTATALALFDEVWRGLGWSGLVWWWWWWRRR